MNINYVSKVSLFKPEDFAEETDHRNKENNNFSSEYNLLQRAFFSSRSQQDNNHFSIAKDTQKKTEKIYECTICKVSLVYPKSGPYKMKLCLLDYRKIRKARNQDCEINELYLASKSDFKNKNFGRSEEVYKILAINFFYQHTHKSKLEISSKKMKINYLLNH